MFAKTAALLLALPAVVLASDWPRTFESPQGTIALYQPQVDAYAHETMSAHAAISVTPAGGGAPVFGAVWLECTVRTNGDNHTVAVREATVRDIKFPEGKVSETGAISSALHDNIPGLGVTFPLDDVRADVREAQSEQESATEIDVAPPKIIVMDHAAVLVLIDGDPVYVDAEGTSLRRVANTPFFIVQVNSSGELFLKGGDSWYHATAIEGPWTVTSEPPREAVTLSEQSAGKGENGEAAPSEAPQAPPRAAAPNAKRAEGPPEIVVSTVPAELIASDGPLKMSPVSGTGLLYASNTPARLFLEIATQQYYLLISGRWYFTKDLHGTWSSVAAESLPGDFSRIPPGSPVDGVLPSVPGTPPAKEAILDAEVPQVAQVDRHEAASTVEYDGRPQFAPIEGRDMAYALNSSSPVIRVGGMFYNCDRGVWFNSPDPEGPWAVCVDVPAAIYTIPPRSPVYYVRYVRVYSYTPSVVVFGYTAGYTGSYVYGGTVVYGTGYYYRPWWGRYYYPRPWTWGFGMNYNPWTGWGFGFGWGWWRPVGWFGYAGWGVVRAGWWGPLGYRPFYRPYAGAVYRAGYRPVVRPALMARTGGMARTAGALRTSSVYDHWTRGVTTPGRPQAARTAIRGRAGVNRGEGTAPGKRQNAPARGGKGKGREGGGRRQGREGRERGERR